MPVTKKRLLAFIIVLALAVGLAYDAQAQNLNTGLQFAQGTGLGNQDIRVTIVRIIRYIIGFLGLLGVLLVMYAGFIWMTAGGNEEKIDQAKKILKNGVIGLVIILSSFAIVSFILGRLLAATGIGGNGSSTGNGTNGSGVSGLGNGIIKSVYPEPFQKDVPRNTAIIVTFREAMRASSICSPVTFAGFCAPGAKIMPDSIKIFRTGDGNGANNVTNVTVASTDNITYVLKPAGPAYLGMATAPVDYTVNLTRGIKKADGKDAFGLTDFRWTFEVGTKLDLTSPKILPLAKGGIFPVTDDEQDTVSGTQAAVSATGTITVNALPQTQQAASVSVATTTGSPTGTAEGTNTCAVGTIDISIFPSGAGLKARVAYSQPGILPEDVNILTGNNRIPLNPCRLSLVLNSAPAAGNSWRLSVAPEQFSDTLSVGSKTYTFVTGTANANQVTIGANPTETAAKIAAAINSIHPEMRATSTASVVNVKAKITGSSGNNLELSTNNPITFAVSRMNGGTDEVTTFSVRDSSDQPKNTVIQINFDEAINPLSIAGTSAEIADKLRVFNADTKADPDGSACTADDNCRSFRCSGGVCQGNVLDGRFLVSNQYKTVEFISNIKCGVNGCGENIYCLPANSEIRIEANAAALMSCSANADCQQAPFNTCVQGVCTDTVGKKNYPVAADSNGIIDMANNSFDGNRNDNPQGKVDTWNENVDGRSAGSTRGDNYLWSFWVSDRLDLTPPKLLSTSVANNQGSVGIASVIEAIFSKLMLSSSLSTGTILVDNGIKQTTHKLINLWSLASDPIGYWVHKEDRDSDSDGRPDRSVALIKHGTLNASSGYEIQAGSGIKDLYQNCYKPSAGPGCNANALMPSCCRNANGDLEPTTDLNIDGNCK